jgi:hypothetical protein
MAKVELCYRDATELAELIRTRQVSAVEVVRAYLDRIAAVNATVAVLADQALASAHAADRALASGAAVGPLHGVPFTVKDSLDLADVVSTRGSTLFRDHLASTDTAVARLRAAGGIPLAKTNLSEFSYWTETDNPLVGRSANPWDGERTPGGSSGGESAAIAAGMSPLGLGSDVPTDLPGRGRDRPGARHHARDRPVQPHRPARALVAVRGQRRQPADRCPARRPLVRRGNDPATGNGVGDRQPRPPSAPRPELTVVDLQVRAPASRTPSPYAWPAP